VRTGRPSRTRSSGRRRAGASSRLRPPGARPAPRGGMARIRAQRKRRRDVVRRHPRTSVRISRRARARATIHSGWERLVARPPRDPGSGSARLASGGAPSRALRGPVRVLSEVLCGLLRDPSRVPSRDSSRA
jgi:hypothetical protein